MTEPRAWLYTRKPEAYPPAKSIVSLERGMDEAAMAFWTETPLYGPEAADRIIALEAEIKKLREALGNIRALAAKRQAEGGPDGSLAHIEGFSLAALEARNGNRR